EGTDLKRLLRAEGRLEAGRALALCAQVADALDAAHERGLVHGDVKPSNVLIATQGTREHPYLADFGLSRSVSEQDLPESGGTLRGTPDYVSPEQIQGAAVDGRTDVYGLGCLFYECLVGEAPFHRNSEIATVYAHLAEPRPKASARRPELGQAVDGVLAKAMAKSPDVRYATCSMFVDSARAELGLNNQLDQAVRGRRRRGYTAAGLIAAVAIGVAARPAVVLQSGGGSPHAAGAIAVIDPTTKSVAQTVRLADPVSAVGAGAAGIWAASLRDDALWRIDPQSLVATPVKSVGAPRDVAVEGGTAYVAAEGPTFGSGNLTSRVAANGNLLDGTEALARTIAAGKDGVWAGGWLGVSRLTAATPLKIRETVPISTRLPLDASHDRQAFNDLALGNGSLWVLGDAADRRLWEVDPRQGRIVKTIALPFAPARIVVGAGSVWVTEQLDDAVARIDPTSGKVIRSIRIGRGAGGIAFGAGSVWAASSLDDTVSQIDPRSNRVVATIGVAGSPTDIGFASGLVWVGVDAS